MAESISPTQTTAAAASTWKLTCSVSGLYASTLYQFFDSGSQDGIVSFLDDIQVQNLQVEYTYSGKETSSFSITGKLVLGSLPLDLKFTHDGKKWDFNAELTIKETPKTTIKDLAENIFGKDLELPDFVADIEIAPKGQDRVGLEITSITPESVSTAEAEKDQAKDDKKQKKNLLFTLWVNVSSITFQAVQFQEAAPDGGEKPPPQRAFLTSVNAIPSVNIPLIGDLPQPFDELLFIYVQSQKKENIKSGMTYGAVTSINASLQGTGVHKFSYKVLKKKYEDSDVVIPSGFHFMLLRKDPKGDTKTVALDYVFGGTKSKKQLKSSSLQVSSASTRGEMVLQETADEPTSAGAQKVPYEKTIGPLSIRNMGFKFDVGKPSSLSVLMDAAVVLGPIGLAVLGFRLELVFEKGMTLKQMPKPEASIDGLAVSFDRSPVILAGMFKHVGTTYQGAAILSFTPYLFEAAGFYGKMESGDVSAFVYFILNGPLATLEFAEIRGVTGGFGYNTNLKFPTASNVMNFPLIKTPDAKKPEDAIATLIAGGWFFPQQGSFWLAAGLTVLAFELLEVKAVVVIEWDPKIKLGLFGLATADVPAGAPVKLAHVQLGLVAAIDFDAGILKVEGQLTPASYVLDPSCHLTGGFALYTWFANGTNAVAGDFVFTIGGYHRSYKPPTQYPIPPRLAISWSYDSSISIRGEAYFAITPKCCMAGGRLDASLTLGPLYAFFNAYADFLINYKPFHFTAEGGLSVGVRFTLDLWICTVHISVEISATLYLQGPPIAGSVHVNFWVFGFDVNFGHPKGIDNLKLNLEEFYKQVLQTDLKSLSTSSETAEEKPAHIFSCNQGLIPPEKQDASSDPNKSTWKVRGAVFQFTIGCKFAVESATVKTGQLDKDAPPIDPLPVSGNNQPIYAKPMHLENKLTSTLTVTITPVAPKMKLLTETDDKPLVPRWDTATMVIKPVPIALWGKYDSSEDPINPTNKTPNQSPGLLSGKDPSVRLPMGIQISSPSPVLSRKDTLPAFDYKTFFVEDAEKNPFPEILAANPKWYPRPVDKPEEMWDRVREQWNGPPGLEDGAAKAVSLWANLSFAKWDLTKPGMISGAKPGNLLKKDVFDSLFLEAPRIAAASS